MKKIKFAVDLDYIDFPSSGKNFIPEWYKNIPSNIDRKKFRLTPDNKDLGTVKRCVPFLDALMGGYMATLWQDLQVTQRNGFPQLNWPTIPPVAEMRDEGHAKGFEAPAGYDSLSFTWQSPYIAQTPPGYSLLITHPMNRFDLPFMTASGLVDADNLLYQGNIPFFLKQGFEGVIPKGTPIFQMIPFKREDWISEKDESLRKMAAIENQKALSVLNGWYKTKVWKKKTYRDGDLSA